MRKVKLYQIRTTKGSSGTPTIKQYTAAIKRLNPNLECRGAYWTWPQAEQSYFEVRDPETNQFVRLRVINTDVPGGLIRIAKGEPKPSEVVKILKNKEGRRG